MSEFFHMGGYAFYVWSSYAIGLTALAVIILVSRSEHKKMLRKLKGKMIRQRNDQLEDNAL